MHTMIANPTVRAAFGVIAATTCILLILFLVMQFSDDMAWSPFDFAVAGILLSGTGLLYVVLRRKVRSVWSRAALGAALVIALALVWLELAVGLVGTPFSGS